MSSDEEHTTEELLKDAARRGDLDRVKSLVSQMQRSSSTSVTPKQLKDPFAQAICKGHIAVTDYLLERGAVVTRYHIDILFAGKSKNELAMFKTWHKHGWDVNSESDLWKPAFWDGVANEPLVRWFLENGANANYGSVGCTLLDHAAIFSTPQVFDLLVSYGARKEDSDALYNAAGSSETGSPGRLGMMQHLIDLGFDVNAMSRARVSEYRRKGQGTPLHDAMVPEQTDRIELLLRSGADPWIKNTLGQTPLEYAIAEDYKVSAEFLQLQIR